MLPDVVNQENDPDVYELVSLLLNQPEDQAGALNKWRAAYIARQLAKESPAEEAVA